MDRDDRLLSWTELRQVCDPAIFPHDTTAEMEPLLEVFGQDRAVRAIRFGLDVSSSGYNLFLAGEPATGKTNILKRILGEVVKGKPVPDDVVYVQNFEDPDTPRVLRLAPGSGARLRHDMEELVQDLRELVPKSFEGKEYDDQRRQITEKNQERRKRLFEALQKEAEASEFVLESTPMGLQATPVVSGKPLTRDDYDRLPEDQRGAIKDAIAKFQQRILEFMSDIKDAERDLKRELKEFDHDVAMNVLGGLMRDLHDRYAEYPRVAEYLEQVQADILENIDQFRQQEEPGIFAGARIAGGPNLTRYAVNLVIDNSSLEGAPVVVETNPTFHNLVGRIERRAQFGALITDFTMIRAGALAHANGGYLVLNIEDVLRNPWVYDALKRAIRDREIRIEELAEHVGLLSSQTLRPEAIPLDVKVCLIGNPRYYHLLYAFDESFRESFKVKADFDRESDRTEESIQKFGSFVARLVEEEKLPHFDRTAMAAIVDEASRRVEDREKMSLQFGFINDVIRQAAYWAGKEGSELVAAEHVRRAVEEIEYRSSLVKERVQELIERDILVVDTAGERVGELNGLAIHMLGDYIFGRPTRVSAVVAVGNDGVINIERQVNLSHSTHDKGVMILTGFLASRFAQQRALALTATLTFEQSYAEVSGDSASSTELYALLSALSGVPIRQGIAATGSVNQRGEVQAVGGVNHKIEGFFDICRAREPLAGQGVIIPRANVQHLMLAERVVTAVREGSFRIWAVDHIDDGIEILTGVEAGAPDEEGGWPEDSINHRVAARLEELAQKLQEKPDAGAPPRDILVFRESDISGLPPPPRPPELPRN